MSLNVDWIAIKSEYIAGDISYRKLAEKYGVKDSTLMRVAVREKWTELREQARKKTTAKMVEKAAKANAKYDEAFYATADKLLRKVSDAIDNYGVDAYSVKQLASALRDLQAIKGIRSDSDRREQEARIEKLRHEAEQHDTGSDTVEVVMNGELEDYSK